MDLLVVLICGGFGWWLCTFYYEYKLFRELKLKDEMALNEMVSKWHDHIEFIKMLDLRRKIKKDEANEPGCVE